MDVITPARGLAVGGLQFSKDWRCRLFFSSIGGKIFGAATGDVSLLVLVSLHYLACDACGPPIPMMGLTNLGWGQRPPIVYRCPFLGQIRA